MKPYKTLRKNEMEEHPDKAESMYRKASVTGKEHGGCKNKQSKAQARRMMKRSDKARVNKEME